MLPNQGKPIVGPTAIPAALPRFPIFIPSKGRWENPLTAKVLYQEGVPFRMVVPADEVEIYTALFGSDHVLERPTSGLVETRNFIRDFSQAEGWERHWQIDDNIRGFMRLFRGKRIPASAATAFRVCEDFTERYTNIGLTGMNYTMFALTIAHKITPFYLNKHVYSCTLMLNSLPFRFRGRYNEDTDICLQVLSGGWCTVLINVFNIIKIKTMQVKGGNTTDLYDHADGRLKMARALERVHPGVVTTTRRFNRPQHRVKNAWRSFDTPLIFKDGLSLDSFPKTNEYGLKLTQVGAQIKSPALRKLVDEANAQTKPDETGGA